MTPDGNGASQRGRVREGGAHRVSRGRSVLCRTVVVGGAAACIGVAFDLAPTAEALSVVFPGFDQNGNSSSVQINVFEGNIFDPQLGINRSNVSNNSLIGNAIGGLGGGLFSNLPGSYEKPFVIGGAAGNGNTTQVNIFSFNIVNPQVAIGGSNTSNNTTVNNVVSDTGNGTTTTATGGGSVFGPMVGNGNAIQLAFFSGNIFNPQWSLGGQNVSNNVAATNIFMFNGNGSQTGTSAGNPMLALLNGNGNVFQGAGFVSNIFNPQFSSGNGNSSNNWATTNNSTGNGNGSDAGTTGGGLIVGSTGNGNTTQTASGSSNIYNDQWNFGIASLGRPTQTSTTRQQDPALVADQDSTLILQEGAGAPKSRASSTTTGGGVTRPANPVRAVARNLQQTAKTVVAAITRKPGSANATGSAAATGSETPTNPNNDDQGGGGNAGNPDGQDK